MSSSTPTPESIGAPLIDQIRERELRRVELLNELAEIDSWFSQMASAAGVALALPAVMAGTPKHATYDGRRKGAMIETALEALKESPNGLSRVELKSKLREHPKHGERLRRNENGFYNMVKRALARGEVVEARDRLYVTGMEPTEPDLSGFDFGSAEGRPV